MSTSDNLITEDGKPVIAEDGGAFGWIMEGPGGGYGTGCLYVEQGERVFFFQGGPALCESVAPSMKMLVEDYQQLDLVEVTTARGTTVKVPKDGRWFFEGPFQRSDVENANKRKYPKKIWSKLIADSKSKPMQDVVSGGMLGHFEHPSDGRTKGPDGAIVVRKLTLQDNGVVHGVGEILNTPHGQILMEYTTKGVRWGVSSRGTGTVATDGVVQDDYNLVTFDAVMNPSTPGAYMRPTGKTESVNEDAQIIVEGMDPLTWVQQAQVWHWTTKIEQRQAKEDDVPLELRSYVQALTAGTDEQTALESAIERFEESVDDDDKEPEQIVADMKAHFDRVYQATVSGKVRPVKGIDLASRLVGLLPEDVSTPADIIDHAIDRLEEATGADRESFDTVVGRLQSRLETVLDEHGDLQVVNESLSAKVQSLESQLRERKTTLASAVEALRKAKAAIHEAKAQRDLALDVVAQSFTVETGDLEIGDAVESAQRPAGIVDAADEHPAEHRQLTLPSARDTMESEDFDTGATYVEEDERVDEHRRVPPQLAAASVAVAGMRSRNNL